MYVYIYIDLYYSMYVCIYNIYIIYIIYIYILCYVYIDRYILREGKSAETRIKLCIHVYKY